jgi:uncharacterized membrane protein
VENATESKQAVKTLLLALVTLVMLVAVDPVMAWLVLAGRMTLFYIYVLYGFGVAIVASVWLVRYLLRDESAQKPSRRLWGLW